MNNEILNDNKSESISDDLSNNVSNDEIYSINEEELYDEPEYYYDFEKKENKTKVSQEINSSSIDTNNKNLQIELEKQNSDNLTLTKLDSKDENLNINLLTDKRLKENNNLFNNSKTELKENNSEISNSELYSIISDSNRPEFEFQEKNSYTYTESESDIDIYINNDLLSSLENAYPDLSSTNEYKKIYKYLKDNKCFDLTIFEIMNIIHREVSIKLTEYKYANNFLNFPSELLDIFDPIYSNSEHLKIMKLYKTKCIDDKNKFFDTKELTEDFFYRDKIEKRRKIIKFLDGTYNYIPKMCKEYNKCDKEDCIYAHNDYEIDYHPLLYKTKYYDNQEYLDSNKALCPTAKNFNEDFRIIYNYKDKNIINLMNQLNDLFQLRNITNKRIKLSVGKIKEFNLNTFKLFKCNNKKCEKDTHLCYKYHDEREKRRAPFLYRYINEKCEEIEIKNKCKNKDFCNKCHTRNELNYHKLNFRKRVLCIRKIKNGKCIFIDTCYGYHDEKAENTIKNKIIDELDTKLEKLKKEKNVDIFKCQQCKKIRKTIIFYYLKCKHILCKKCYNSIKSEEICPICKKSFDSDKVVKIDFKESSKNIDELITKNNK